MEIISKLIEIETQMPVDNNVIEQKLKEMGIKPLRWAIVKCGSWCEEKIILTISLACESL